MLEPDGPIHHGVDKQSSNIDRGRSGLAPGASELLIPKNRSTGNLSAHPPKTTDKSRIRFSFDAGLSAPEYDTMSRSPIMTEHEHGLGASGLRRIRQQPLSRAPTMPSSDSSSRNTSIGPRSSSMTLTFPTSRTPSMILASGPSSPTLNFTEDLSRFPSESLHSFSFAHQSEESLHSRQTLLKRSVEFMSQKLGWGTLQTGTAAGQTKHAGDQDVQGMLEFLARAKLAGAGNIAGFGHLAGPFTTSSIGEDTENVFDTSFLPPSESPGLYESPDTSPTAVRRPALTFQPAPLDQPSSTYPMDEAQKGSEGSSRTETDESGTTAKTSPLATRRQSFKKAYGDAGRPTLDNILLESRPQPFGDSRSQPFGAEDIQGPLLSPILPQSPGHSFMITSPHAMGPAVHGHSSRWAPAAQAIFTTESTAPYTILAANDLACLVFGVTKAEVGKMGILEVVQQERRAWLEEKLGSPGSASIDDSGKRTPTRQSKSQHTSPSSTTTFFLGKSGVTASLLNRPNSRQTQNQGRRSQTDDGAGSSLVASTNQPKGQPHHPSNKSRGVLLCGDVVPIQKRNGATGSASLWVKEKRGGLIWVLEEIHEDVAIISLDDDAVVTKISGSTGPIWGENFNHVGIDIGKLLPRLPRQGIDSRTGEIDYAEVSKRKYFTACNPRGVNIPCVVERVQACTDLKVSSFPHIAGIMVLSAKTLEITSSNSVFSAALFGQEKPDGRSITALIPDFDRLLDLLVQEDGVQLVDGIVIPEHSFRRARAFLALRDGKSDASSYFSRPDGLLARHRDGTEIKIDAQLRVVKSETKPTVYDENVIEERSDEEDDDDDDDAAKSEVQSELVYALWITYSRHIHIAQQTPGATSPFLSGIQTPLHQPSPGQTEVASPVEMDSDEPRKEPSHASLLTAQLKAVAKKTAAKLTGRENPAPIKDKEKEKVPEIVIPTDKKCIEDFVILEDMGQGAYGQVKLARFKKNGNRKVVLKYVTKRRILVDTWTRDRRLGTVPLEIHVLDYLRRDGLKHPNIVEMSDFFEDDVNYYIEMVPHGLPGMDLFDYIELRVNMEENECRSIFVQVARAIQHLHTKALVVHRDIKDENVVLDGEGNIKLIDFGSAAYIKSGPFDVFVGTIDYAAPEVLAGKPYRGKEQDIWALGILLYTIVYKENPFYSIDEIMDRDLRVPYVMSDDSIDLIREMLDRDVDSRIGIDEVMQHPWCLAADGD